MFAGHSTNSYKQQQQQQHNKKQTNTQSYSRL